MIEWCPVRILRTRQVIGAVGFIDDRLAVVSTFYPDRDWDHDGRVDLLERFGTMFTMRGMALADVLTRAIEDPDIMLRDTSIRELHGRAVVQFASGMILEGLYCTYLRLSVRQASSILASSLVNGAAARFFVRKGMEQAVKQVYNTAIYRR